MSLGYWDQQFQFTRILPDFQDCLARMAARSQAVQLRFGRLDYGHDPRQFVEVSGTPVKGGALPVFIHGGYWRALNAETHRFLLPPLRDLTGAVANLEYRLLPQVTLAEILGDALAGLRLLAERFKTRLVVVGHSAGGHLAVTAAHKMPDIVAGAVSISGLYDLEPLQWSFLRDEVGLKASDLDGLDPQQLWAGCDARHVTVAVGARETPEFHRQAHLFASSHGARFLEVESAHHMTVLDALADPGSPLVSEVARLLEAPTPPLQPT